MKSTADTYHDAAQEHLVTAQELHEAGNYYLSHYIAGLAVECMLRAFLRAEDKFDADHNLAQLAEKANFYEYIPTHQWEQFAAKFTQMNVRWRSNHRFFAQSEVRRYLRSVGADAGAKGDTFKNNSRTLLNLAIEVLNQGEASWQKRKSASQKK